MTVKENIIFFSKFNKIENFEQKLVEYLNMFNLTAKADTLAANLSGG